MGDDALDLTTFREPPIRVRYGLHRDERLRRYGREHDVLYHAGDVLALDDWRRLVRVTGVPSDVTLEVRPYPNEEERRANDAYLAGIDLAAGSD